MIGAAQINNTMNENTTGGAGAAIQKQLQSNAISTLSTIRTGSFIRAGDGSHNAEGLAKVIQLGD
jgi:hypothetical protein